MTNKKINTICVTIMVAAGISWYVTVSLIMFGVSDDTLILTLTGVASLLTIAAIISNKYSMIDYDVDDTSDIDWDEYYSLSYATTVRQEIDAQNARIKAMDDAVADAFNDATNSVG